MMTMDIRWNGLILVAAVVFRGETCLMKSESFALAPEHGWPGYVRSSELEELLWASLLCVGSGGIWHYYNLTSDTSIWSADSSPNSYLYTGWDRTAPGQTSKIHDMAFLLAEDHSEYFAELSELVCRLMSDFGLCCSPIYDKTGNTVPD